MSNLDDLPVRALEAFAGVVVAAFLVERAAALLIESRFWKVREDQAAGRVVTLMLALTVCLELQLDALSFLGGRPSANIAGTIATALLVAGGTAAIVRLFRQGLGVGAGLAVPRPPSVRY